MIRIYTVWINRGFGGVKYFQHEENAYEYAYEVGGEVASEYATPREWYKLDFSDPAPVDYI